MSTDSNHERVRKALNTYISDNIRSLRERWARSELRHANEDLSSFDLELDEIRDIIAGRTTASHQVEDGVKRFQRYLAEEKKIPSESLQDLRLSYLEARSTYLGYGRELITGAPESKRLKAAQSFAPWFQIETPGDSAQEEHLKISEIRDRYIAERRRAHSKERSIAASSKAVDYFIEVCGDLPSNEVNRKQGQKFKELYSKYPANLNKMPQTRGLTFSEILAKGIEYQTISITTLQNNLGKLSAFFTWACDNGYVAENPVAKMQIKTKTRAKENRLPFTEEELKGLFTPESHNLRTLRHANRFWVPLVALYTGARIEEICQLYLDDIQEADSDIPSIFFRATRSDQSLKNLNSQRRVPLHSELIQIGFLKYVAAMKYRGEARLFPELSHGPQGYSGTVSKWFGRYKKKFLEESRQEKVVFHSFRHTLTDKLRAVRATTYEIDAISGRASEHLAHQVYGSDIPLSQLQECLERISFTEVVDVPALSELVDSLYSHLLG